MGTRCPQGSTRGMEKQVPLGTSHPPHGHASDLGGCLGEVEGRSRGGRGEVEGRSRGGREEVEGRSRGGRGDVEGMSRGGREDVERMLRGCREDVERRSRGGREDKGRDRRAAAQWLSTRTCIPKGWAVEPQKRQNVARNRLGMVRLRPAAHKSKFPGRPGRSGWVPGTKTGQNGPKKSKYCH